MVEWKVDWTAAHLADLKVDLLAAGRVVRKVDLRVSPLAELWGD